MSSALSARSSAAPSASWCMPSWRISGSSFMSPAACLLRPSNLSRKLIYPPIVGGTLSSMNHADREAAAATIRARDGQEGQDTSASQARRAGAQTARDDARNKKILYAIGASGFVMLAVVVGFFALTGGGDDAESAEGAIAKIKAAGWTFQTTKSQGRTHVPELAANFKYNTVPGTSGPHSNQTVVYGVYDQQVSEFNYVHNLEHGAVGMFYGPDVPEETVAQMQEFYNQDPRGLIMAPDDRLGDQIALTAWTHIAKGKTFD